MSLWQHHFEPSSHGTVVCRDSFARWSGAGNTEFRERVTNAFRTNQLVRAVIAHAGDVAAVQAGKDASKARNTFSVREDWQGRVMSIEGENYVIEFKRR